MKKVVKQVILVPGLNAFKDNNRASLLDLTIRNTLQFSVLLPFCYYECKNIKIVQFFYQIMFCVIGFQK